VTYLSSFWCHKEKFGWHLSISVSDLSFFFLVSQGKIGWYLSMSVSDLSFFFLVSQGKNWYLSMLTYLFWNSPDLVD